MSNASVDNKLDQLLKAVRELCDRVGKIERRAADPKSSSQDSPRLEAEKTPTPLHKSIEKSVKLRLRRCFRFVRRYVWAPILLTLTLMGGISAYTALEYDVLVSPYISLVPTDALQSHFLVANQGPFEIFNVSYVCRYAPVQSNEEQLKANAFITYGWIVPLTIPRLRSHGQFSAYCHYSHPLYGPLKEGTLLNFEVTYTPKFLSWLPRRGGALFLLKYDKAGSAVWLPVGDMLPNADDLRRFYCATCGP